MIVAGPCSAESRAQVLDTCRALAAGGRVDMLRAGVWKPRTSPSCFQGVGRIGLEWLAEASRATGLPFGVEVASAEHIEAAVAAGASMVWIGARTTGNPFSMQEIAEALRGSEVTVMVKNPAIPDVGLWRGAVERLTAAGVAPERIVLIHRGFSQTGRGLYRNPPMWHIALDMRRDYPGLKMLCDPSHICGSRERLREISQKAADLSYDGLFVESHIDPSSALSDASQQLTPVDLDAMLDAIVWRREESPHPAFEQAIERCRLEIDQIDMQVFDLLARRMVIAEDIGRIKLQNDVTILQRQRWEEIVDTLVGRAGQWKLSPDFVRSILEAIHMESIARQNGVMNPGEDGRQ